ncbi:DUF3267 domain-containing protein [Pseudoalteromonas sp. OFAV1]|uniref:DUF3267 domain-containing protein n=1 Tax=Pseudoalteromonas sp. OFAV1 TaxID=2908892 RepID=UPI001F24BCAC|nr:DUF3267 domain-containing protein [Pseudoalteromonas sp. OFAV1]MCF2902248.1 DUF3267 domain-containing protein [Pseudoalteromonas sp. OFAV1]
MFVKYYNDNKTDKSKMAQPTSDDWIQHNEFAKFKHMRIINYLSLFILLAGYVSCVFYFPNWLDDVTQHYSEIQNILALLCSIGLYFFIHELFHLIAMPKPKEGESRYFLFHNTLIAVFYNGYMSINRYKFIVLTPFIVLSFIIFPLAYYTEGLVSSVLWFVGISHLGSCIYDICIIFKLKGYSNYKEIYTSPLGMYFR